MHSGWASAAIRCSGLAPRKQRGRDWRKTVGCAHVTSVADHGQRLDVSIGVLGLLHQAAPIWRFEVNIESRDPVGSLGAVGGCWR